LAKLASGNADAWFAPEAPKAPFTGEIDTFWSLRFAGGKILAGAKPANLFQSEDDLTWERQSALATFPGREAWFPGAAGLVLHTILADPDCPEKLWIGISAAGVFASEDGGESWQRLWKGLPQEACFFTVLRQAMAVDPDGGLYFGTNTGSVFARREGESLEEIARHLPTICSVEIA
jgi:photosystem II stability/assembly factor-like uncharacterized protein